MLSSSNFRHQSSVNLASDDVEDLYLITNWGLIQLQPVDWVWPPLLLDPVQSTSCDWPAPTLSRSSSMHPDVPATQPTAPQHARRFPPRRLTLRSIPNFRARIQPRWRIERCRKRKQPSMAETLTRSTARTSPAVAGWRQCPRPVDLVLLEEVKQYVVDLFS